MDREDLSRRALRRVATELEAREERGLLERFKAFLAREGLSGDEARLACGEIDLDDFRRRLGRLFGFGVALAGAILLIASLTVLLGGRRGEAEVGAPRPTATGPVTPAAPAGIGLEARLRPRP